MAADIGAKIGIDGEKAFRESLRAMNSQLKTLGSEMKAVVSSFSGAENSEEALTAKTDVLGRSVEAAEGKLKLLQGQSDRAKNKLSDLADALDDAKQKFGENSEEAIKAQNAYNRQVTAVNKLETQINGTKTDLNRFKTEMKQAGEAAENMGDDLQQVGSDAEAAGSSFASAFAGGVIAGGVQALASSIGGLVEQTTEYRKIMGTLEVSSEKAGYTAEQTAQTYSQLYNVIGDNQQAATAAANLQALGLSQEQLTQLTNGAIGAWATYGDSIPIDGLAEAINETAQAGVVTGTFADVLNWAGTSEDAFNEKLAAAGSASERANIILQELADQGLIKAAESWRINNAEIVAANEATNSLEQATGRLGEMLSPLVSGAKEGIGDVLNGLLDLVAEGDPVIIMLGGMGAALAAMGIGTFIVNLAKTSTALGKVGTAFSAVNEVMMANPIMLVVGLLAGLVTALVAAYNTNEQFRAKVDAAWNSLKGSVANAAASVKNAVQSVKDKLTGFVNSIKGLPTQMRTIGRNIIGGLINGIKAKAGELLTAGKNLVRKVKNVFTGKGGFDIHSPSRWAEDKGERIPEGMANGVDKGSGKAVTAMENLADGMKKPIEKSAEEIEQEAERIEQSVKTMTDKLIGYGDLLQSKRQGDDEVFFLGDLQKEIETIEKYRDGLEELKNRGLSADLFEEIAKMGVDDATTYMGELLSLTDKELSEYINLYTEKTKLAETVARDFYGAGEKVGVNLQEGIEKATSPADLSKTGKEAGTMMTSEIISGMKEKEPELLTYLRSMQDRINRTFEGFRTENRRNGLSVMEEIAQGIRDGRGIVANAMQQAISDAMSIGAGGTPAYNTVYGDTIVNVASVASTNDAIAIGRAIEFQRESSVRGKGGI